VVVRSCAALLQERQGKERKERGGIMTRLSKPEEDIRKGAWTAEEDEKLRVYVETNGTGHWRSVGKKAGRVTISRCVCV